MKWGKEILVGIFDEEGNIVFYYCVLFCFKFVFKKVFFLYKNKNWKMMINGEGKSFLDIVKNMEWSRLSEGN